MAAPRLAALEATTGAATGEATGGGAATGVATGTGTGAAGAPRARAHGSAGIGSVEVNGIGARDRRRGAIAAAIAAAIGDGAAAAAAAAASAAIGAADDLSDVYSCSCRSCTAFAVALCWVARAVTRAVVCVSYET